MRRAVPGSLSMVRLCVIRGNSRVLPVRVRPGLRAAIRGGAPFRNLFPFLCETTFSPSAGARQSIAGTSDGRAA